MNPAIVVVGSINTDMIVRCTRLPSPGETASATRIGHGLGGKGANQAVAAARLGASVSMIACVGEDEAGAQAIARLQKETVDTRFVSTAAAPTGAASVWVEASGQNAILVHEGANALLGVQHIDAAADLIRGASVLVCQLETPLPTVMRACEIAAAANVPVVLNPAPAPARSLPPALLQAVDLLVPNQSEAVRLAGLQAGGHFLASDAAALLRSMGARNVLITLGRAGAYLDAANVKSSFAAPLVAAVDTTGAGDTFIGALAVALCLGAEINMAVAFAVEAAAISVTRPGTMDSMPTAADMDWSCLAPRRGTVHAPGPRLRELRQLPSVL